MNLKQAKQFITELILEDIQEAFDNQDKPNIKLHLGDQNESDGIPMEPIHCCTVVALKELF
jgi:hypothetical protein